MTDKQSIEDLCDAAIQSSDPSSCILALTEAIKKCPTEDLLERPLLVFQAFLDPTRIPDGSNMRSGPENRQTFRVALLCIRGLAATRIHFPNHWPKLVDFLIQSWPIVFKWLHLLCHQFITHYRDCVKPFPLLTMTSILDIARSYAEDSRLRVMLAEFPQFLNLLMQCWTFEAQMPNATPGTHSIEALSIYLSEFSSQRNWIHERIMPMLGEKSSDTRFLASCAVAHVRRSATIPVDCLRLAQDVDTLFHLSDWYKTRLHILFQHSIEAVTQALLLTTTMIQNPLPRSASPEVASCLASCYRYLLRHFEHFNGASWVAEALDLGLLSALLSTNLWISTHEDPDTMEEVARLCILILSKVLPRQLIFYKVVQSARKSLRKLSMRKMERKALRHGRLGVSWKYFKELTEERWNIHKTMKDLNQVKFRSCHNFECDVRLPERRMKRCKACQEALYCSSTCQDQHWRHGGHSTACSILRRSRLPHLSNADIRRQCTFLQEVVIYPLLDHKDLVLFLYREIPYGSTLVIHMDYNVVPCKMICTSTSAPFPKNLKEDVDSYQGLKWTNECQPGEVLLVVRIPDGCISL